MKGQQICHTEFSIDGLLEIEYSNGHGFLLRRNIFCFLNKEFCSEGLFPILLELVYSILF